MQVKVRIDITKPLCRGRKIGLSDGKEGWVNFKYKCLPNLCYWCGRLTHHDKECSVWLARKGTLHCSGQQFGSWLQVNTLNLAKKTVIRVAGYEKEKHEDNKTTLYPKKSEGGMWKF